MSRHFGVSIMVDHMYRSFVATIKGYETSVDRLCLSMMDFNMILDMD